MVRGFTPSGNVGVYNKIMWPDAENEDHGSSVYEGLNFRPKREDVGAEVLSDDD